MTLTVPLSNINNGILVGALVWCWRHGVGGLRSSVALSMVLLACHTSTWRVCGWMARGLRLGQRGWSQWQCRSPYLGRHWGALLRTLQGSSGESHVQIPRRIMAVLSMLYPSSRSHFGGLVHKESTLFEIWNIWNIKHLLQHTSQGPHLPAPPCRVCSCNTCNINHLLQHTSETHETFTTYVCNICVWALQHKQHLNKTLATYVWNRWNI
jgi:hypothetical protein